MARKIQRTHIMINIVILMVFIAACSPTEDNSPAANNVLPKSTNSATPSATPTPYPPALRGTPIASEHKEITTDNIDQLTQLARWGNGVPIDIEYSPNGEFLAVSSTIGVYLFDADTFTLLQRFEDYDSVLGMISFSPDSKSLALATSDCVEIIAVPEWRRLTSIKERVLSIEYSPTGEKFALSACNDGACSSTTIEVFDNTDYELLQSIYVEDKIYHLAFSPDEGQIGGILSNYEVIVYNLADESIIFDFGPTPIGRIPTDIAFSPDGKYFAIGSRARVLLYDANDFTERDIESPSFAGLPSCIAFSPDSQLLAVGEEQGIFIMHVDSGTVDQSFGDALGLYTGLSWSKDGRHIASISNFEPHQIEKSVSVWDIEHAELVTHLDEFSSPKERITWSPDGNLIATTSSGYYSLVEVLYAFDGSTIYAFEADNGAWFLSHLSFSMENKLSKLEIEDIITFQLIEDSRNDQTLILAYSPVPFTFSPDGSLFATLYPYNDPRILIWKMSSGEIVQAFDVEGDPWINPANNLEFGTSGDYLYVPLEDMDTRKVVFQKLNIKDGSSNFLSPYPSRDFALSPDEKWFATIDGNIYPIDENGRAIELSESIEYSYLGSVDWSPNGQLVVIASKNNEIVIIDASNGEILTSLDGHKSTVTDFEFSADGSLLASISYDGTVRIWGIP